MSASAPPNPAAPAPLVDPTTAAASAAASVVSPTPADPSAAAAAAAAGVAAYGYPAQMMGAPMAVFPGYPGGGGAHYAPTGYPMYGAGAGAAGATGQSVASDSGASGSIGHQHHQGHHHHHHQGHRGGGMYGGGQGGYSAPGGGSAAFRRSPRLSPEELAAQAQAQQKTTLWMGLEPGSDENTVRDVWAAAMPGESVTVKMIRDRYTNMAAAYCFVDFPSYEVAARAMAFEGQALPTNAAAIFRLNWAAGGGLQHEPKPYEFSLFVGDLAPEVTDDELLAAFTSRYPSTKGAKVVVDLATNMSRGFGFVRLDSQEEHMRALGEMTGVVVGSRAIRVGPATPKLHRPVPHHQSGQHQGQQHHYQGGNGGGRGGYGGGGRGGYGGQHLQQLQYGAGGGASAGYGSPRQHHQQHQHHGYSGSGSSSGGSPGSYAVGGGAASSSTSPGHAQGSHSSGPSAGSPAAQAAAAADPSNTTVFVGGLSQSVTEDDIRKVFSPVGEIALIKIPAGKSCAFVSYAHRDAAEKAIAELNGITVGSNKARLSWGRPNHHHAGGGGQGHHHQGHHQGHHQHHHQGHHQQQQQQQQHYQSHAAMTGSASATHGQSGAGGAAVGGHPQHHIQQQHQQQQQQQQGGAAGAAAAAAAGYAAYGAYGQYAAAGYPMYSYPPQQQQQQGQQQGQQQQYRSDGATDGTGVQAGSEAQGQQGNWGASGYTMG
ncbi:hypothetical protein BC828DRAFT_387085 [Blastocladiella britannica]|nr:hypothetical protein BC828DRAFT_387085 [Blastocladiella britannica]